MTPQTYSKVKHRIRPDVDDRIYHRSSLVAAGNENDSQVAVVYENDIFLWFFIFNLTFATIENPKIGSDLDRRALNGLTHVTPYSWFPTPPLGMNVKSHWNLHTKFAV